jgi:hypothetical protein
MDNISKARERLDKIKYYYKNAGPNGYSQALYYYSELGNIYRKANKNDAPIIRIFYNEASALMAEMKKLEDDQGKGNN